MTRPALFISALLLLSACAARAPLPLRLYQLSATTPVTHQSPLASSVGIGPLKWPDYLSRKQMVVRLDAGRLDTLENERWAEPLEANFERVLRENIVRAARPQRLQSHPWSLTDTPAIQVPIEVLQFDSDREGETVLRARWRIVGRDKQELLSERDSAFRRRAEDASPAAAVAAQSALLGELGSEISKALSGLQK